jgi:DNA-binding transcriptional ArsR family regulator
MKRAAAACCPAPKASRRGDPCPPTAAAIEATAEHVDAFKALAHPGRLRVFFHLVRAGTPLPANEVQSALDLPAPTLSHHLESLERAGLIERTRKERFILSAVKKDMVVELVRILTACC